MPEVTDPPVSTMSSIMSTVLSLTSPTRLVISATLCAGLLLCIMASVAPSRSLSFFANFALPVSGETTTRSGRFFFEK